LELKVWVASCILLAAVACSHPLANHRAPLVRGNRTCTQNLHSSIGCSVNAIRPLWINQKSTVAAIVELAVQGWPPTNFPSGLPSGVNRKSSGGILSAFLPRRSFSIQLFQVCLQPRCDETRLYNIRAEVHDRRLDAMRLIVAENDRIHLKKWS
jgi:hypothetical protein